MQKKCAIGEQNVMKLEVFILGRQRIDQKRKKGWGRGRRERIEKGSRETSPYAGGVQVGSPEPPFKINYIHSVHVVEVLVYTHLLALSYTHQL